MVLGCSVTVMLSYRYLTGKINEGEAHNITCPGFDCSRLVPVDVIETLVPRDIARRYLQFDIKVCKLTCVVLRLTLHKLVFCRFAHNILLSFEIVIDL